MMRGDDSRAGDGDEAGAGEAKEEASSSGEFASGIFAAVGASMAGPPLEESVRQLTGYVRDGAEQAKKVEGKEVLMVLGNTGAGKSTFINYCNGQTMERVDLGTLSERTGQAYTGPPFEQVVVAADEVTPIGHNNASQTLLPGIVPASASSPTCCDCPGFGDNRGAATNIANAVNIQQVLKAASSVKMVVMVNYHSFMADRSKGVQSLIDTCKQLFGGVESLQQHASSILIGLNKAPANVKIDQFKRYVAQGDTSGFGSLLADRFFLFDPLDESAAQGAWSRDELLKQMAALPAVAPSNVGFQVTLNDNDRAMLHQASREVKEKIEKALEEGDFERAKAELGHLEKLGIIEHPEVRQCLAETSEHLERHFQEFDRLFREACLKEEFSTAETQLKMLQEAAQCFGEKLERVVNVEELGQLLEKCKEQRDKLQALEDQAERQREEINGLQDERWQQERAARMQWARSHGLLLVRNKYQEALDGFKEALGMYKLLDSNLSHYMKGQCLEGIGMCYMFLQNYSLAITNMEEARSVYEGVSSEPHIDPIGLIADCDEHIASMKEMLRLRQNR
ncbi:MAG: hypothetical protein ROO73_05590 [Roseivirga sp.]